MCAHVIVRTCVVRTRGACARQCLDISSWLTAAWLLPISALPSYFFIHLKVTFAFTPLSASHSLSFARSLSHLLASKSLLASLLNRTLAPRLAPVSHIFVDLSISVSLSAHLHRGTKP
jgi:hypothetical protein